MSNDRQRECAPLPANLPPADVVSGPWILESSAIHDSALRESGGREREREGGGARVKEMESERKRWRERERVNGKEQERGRDKDLETTA